MITLYIETNFFIDFAKKQDQDTENLVNSQYPEVTTKIKIVTPAICCMESLSVLESERNRSNRFKKNLDDEVSKLKGDRNSTYSGDIKLYLRQAIIKNNERINEINTRLFDVLEWATKTVDLIQLKPDILSKSMENILINDPTDNLILHCILDHAKTSTNEKKVFLSGNHTDFGKPEIKEILQEASIEIYFVKTGDFLGWLNSQF
ncbi:DUF4935 domain-containing protein [Sphaerospermopsis sp. FACHB-1094]|jgi:hypothetical protein|uniref:PIN domain-containing protein n=1 Tax=Sphaerospermopsis sp. FACHB-1094 TaxID=2692861 RepID=UPI001689F6A0|nr:PIN domain-containing protein [Sphaerospermopsis sp. FACHB-1094]MBD2133235.1 DUF4935 domain-containing protein [Sphaerospermopsis sp. FACHB-1094]